MASLIAIILLDIIVVAAVMYWGTRDNSHETTLESPSVVQMRNAAQRRQEALQQAAAEAEAEADEGDEAEESAE